MLGWVFGFVAPPSWLTFVGGGIVIVANVLIVTESNKRNKGQTQSNEDESGEIG